MKRTRKKKVNPDAYMPVYGDKLLTASKGYGEKLFARYFKALWHNWSHCHCAGIPNDEAYMQNICECPDVEWSRTKGIIFGVFFSLGRDGKWHQQQQDEIHAEAQAKYKARCDGAANARLNNPKNNPDLRTEPSTDTSSETSADNRTGEDLDQKPKPNVAYTHIPAWDEVKLAAEKMALAGWKAQDWFNEMEACDWIDYNHRPIVNWPAALSRVKTKWEADGRPTSPPKSKAYGPNTSRKNPGTDRNAGTFNEGKAHLYANAAINAPK